MKIKIDESAYSSHFKDVLYSFDRYIIAYGGRGSGKTDTFYLKYLLSLFEPYYFRLLYINKEKSNIRDQQYAGFKRVARRIGIYDKLKFYDGDYRIVNPYNDNSLIPKGMDDTEKTKGIDDITTIWWDECNKGTIEDYTTLNKLLRSPKAKYLQFALSFNPVMETSWMRNEFFDTEDAYKVAEKYKNDLLLNHSTYIHNEFINQDEYLETLKKGNPYNYDVDIYGKWGKPEIKSPWLYSWQSNRDKIISDDLPYYDSLPIYVSFDFNNDPLSCIVAQHSSGNHNITANPFIHILKEYQTPFKGTVQNPFIDIYNKIKQDYNNPRQIFITGDASGFHGRMGLVDGSRHFYDLILKTFNLGEYHLKTPLTNPLHTASRHNFNTLIHYHPMFKISKKGCPNLINDMDIAEATDKNGKGDELLKDRKENKMDLFDAERYYLWTFFNTFK